MIDSWQITLQMVTTGRMTDNIGMTEGNIPKQGTIFVKQTKEIVQIMDSTD